MYKKERGRECGKERDSFVVCLAPKVKRETVELA